MVIEFWPEVLKLEYILHICVPLLGNFRGYVSQRVQDGGDSASLASVEHIFHPHSTLLLASIQHSEDNRSEKYTRGLSEVSASSYLLQYIYMTNI